MTLLEFAHYPKKCRHASVLLMNNEVLRNQLCSQKDGPSKELKAIRNSPIFGYFPQPILYVIFVFSNVCRRRIISFVDDADTYFFLICSCKLFKRYFASTLDLRWCQEDRITHYKFLYSKKKWINIKRFKLRYETRYGIPIETKG